MVGFYPEFCYEGACTVSRILVTSCKGGVGKSTVSAGIAIALSRMGKKVLLVDFDLGNRSLDLMLGMEDDLIYDICDLTSGRVDCESVVHLVPAYPNLAFIGAPFRYEGDMTETALADALHRLEEVYGFDFVLIDTSGGAHESVALAAPVSDIGIIVSSQNPTSIRAAEKSGLLLDEAGVTDQYLVINGFDMQPASATARAGVVEMIDRTRTRLLGIVPMDVRLTLLSEKGKSVFEGEDSNARRAFENIAARLGGTHVPLLDGFRGIKRQKLLFG